MAYKLQQNVKRGKCARIAPLLFFFPPLFPPFPSLSLSLFFLSLCSVSHTTPLFYQINISQNKSQDNFKLAREERGGKKRETGKRGREGEFGSVCAPPVKWSLCLPAHLILRSVVLSSPSWSQLHLTDEVVTTAYECQMRENSEHPCWQRGIYIRFVTQAEILLDLDKVSSRYRTALPF